MYLTATIKSVLKHKYIFETLFDKNPLFFTLRFDNNTTLLYGSNRYILLGITRN